MRRPGSRTSAYLLLWLLLAAITLVSRPPPAPVEVLRAPRPAEPFTIDVNQAPWHQLTLIEGIGETLARRIVRAREERGGFRSLEEVQALPGVPDRPLDEARGWLRLGDVGRGARTRNGG